MSAKLDPQETYCRGNKLHRFHNYFDQTHGCYIELPVDSSLTIPRSSKNLPAQLFLRCSFWTRMPIVVTGIRL